MMCYICVVHKSSRWVATMLPWFVVPLIGLWALSQLLPPAFRFEITSSRLVCVSVLLLTLLWYEVLMPQLSAWRIQRNAGLMEKKRFEALQLQKLRKTATRKCRNCLTPYKDQNPCGGKFMCSYCGHLSKRPVLDLPIPPGLGISNPGIMKELLGKGGKIFPGKVWSDDNGSMCSEWLEHGNWVVGASFEGNSTFPSTGAGGLLGGSEKCLDDKCYQPAFIVPSKCLMYFFKSLSSICRKLLMTRSSRDDGMFDAERKAMLANRVENGSTCHESRAEKARRKAEEKRQARLERELLEEEERNQREEVARLVEERRKLRDEKLDAENGAKGVYSIRETNRKKAERRRLEKKMEKDMSKSKRSSDAEGSALEKRVGKDTERKRELETKDETAKRESHKTGSDGFKGHISRSGPGFKTSSTNVKPGIAGMRYFDRMKGTFLSSSRAVANGSFFNKASHIRPASKECRSGGSVDHTEVIANKRESYPSECVHSKLATNGDGQNSNIPVLSDSQSRTAPKSWQQLFIETPALPASSNTNVNSIPFVNSHNEVHKCQLPSRSPSPPTYDNPISFGLPSPFISPSYSSGLLGSVSVHPTVKDPLISHAGDISHELLPDEPELFEDPCYEPDLPVSESLDKFQLDFGVGFKAEKVEMPHRLMDVSTALETSRPSPIESPMSRLGIADERKNRYARLPDSPKVQEVHPFPSGDLNTTNGMGTWHMWSSPLCQDSLGFAGAPVSCSLPLEVIRSSKESYIHAPPHENRGPLFSQDAPVGSYSPQKIFLDYQYGSFASSVPGLKDPGLWPQKTHFPTGPPLSSVEGGFVIQRGVEDTSQKKMAYGSPSRSAANESVDLSLSNFLTKNGWEVLGSGEGLGSRSAAESQAGRACSPPDVQSVWSFE